MKNKKILLGVLVGILLVGVVGVTYAIFSYSQVGDNQQLITGDIYMHYKESNELTISNALPSNTYDLTKYFEFTIDGKNTNTKYDIYYDINLLRGAVPDGKTETNRIQDKFIKFRLTEFVENETTHEMEETEIFTNKSYSDLSSSKRVHVDTISKNTREKVTHTYRLYMWISNEVVIGNTENPDKDYDITTWNNLFASIKVSSTGDFNEKYLTTPPQCFISEDNGDNTVTVTGKISGYDLNSIMTPAQIQTCVVDLTNMWGSEEGAGLNEGETYQGFCNGTGTAWGNTFQEWLDYGYFYDEQINEMANNNYIILSKPQCNSTNIIIPSTINGKSVTTIGNNAFNGNQLTSVEIPDSVTTIESDAFGNNQLTSITIGNSVTTIGNNAFWYNRLTSVTIPNSVTTIGSQAFSDNQLTSVTIPNSVTTLGTATFTRNQLTSVTLGNSVTEIGIRAFSDNQLTSVTIPNSVTTIGDYAFWNNQLTSVTIGNSVTTIGSQAFSDNQLTSVTLGNSVTTIGSQAFSYNQLTSVTIPNSVTTIGSQAFSYNQLTSVTIGNGITEIGIGAFQKLNSTYASNGITYYNNPNLTSIVIDKTCSTIKSMNNYPWLSSSRPYIGSYSAGTTIYGSNNEVCDAF